MQFQKLISPGILGNVLAFVAGALLTLAFAPFHFFILAILSPSFLLALWLYVSPRQALLRGWLFGLGLFTTGVYWIFISVHTYGNTSLPFALFITASLIALLALFPAYHGFLLNRYFPSNNFYKLCFVFPAIGVVLEWVRSWLFSGFPWLFLGYSQINTPLKGFAPIVSVYGVSLAVLFTSALVLNLVLNVQQRNKKAVFLNLFLLLSLWIAGGVLSNIKWTYPIGPSIKISLVQGNISQSLKWSADQVLPTLNHYETLTQPHWDSQLIIWPESAIPITLQDASHFIDEMAQTALTHHSTLITGLPVESPQPGSFYNSVIAVGEGTGVYAKRHLVPFGEFIPMQSLFKKFFDFLKIPMSDFIPGPSGLKPIQIDKLKIAAFICYEIAFPEQVRSRDSQIGMLLTVSNDAWFGHSIAQAQHLEIAQMRALEMGRPVIFVSNNGLTAFIKPNGKIQSIAPAYESYVLTDSLQAYQGKTRWDRKGLDPLLFVLFTLLIAGIRRRNKN